MSQHLHDTSLIILHFCGTEAGHITTDLASFGLPHDKKKYVGSVLIIESETPEEVQKFIEADVYYKNEVVSVALPRMST